MQILYHIMAKDNENIPDYINQMKTLIDQINSMNTHFKVSNIMLKYLPNSSPNLGTLWSMIFGRRLTPWILITLASSTSSATSKMNIIVKLDTAMMAHCCHTVIFPCRLDHESRIEQSLLQIVQEKQL